MTVESNAEVLTRMNRKEIVIVDRQLDTRLPRHWRLPFCVAVVLLAQDQASPQEKSPAFSKTVYTYKTVDRLQIRADVYRHEYAEKRPVVVWLHGGAPHWCRNRRHANRP